MGSVSVHSLGCIVYDIWLIFTPYLYHRALLIVTKECALGHLLEQGKRGGGITFLAVQRHVGFNIGGPLVPYKLKNDLHNT